MLLELECFGSFRLDQSVLDKGDLAIETSRYDPSKLVVTFRRTLEVKVIMLKKKLELINISIRI